MIKAEGVDAAEAHATLRALGLQPLDGSNNDATEMWVASSGHPYLLPYLKRGDKSRVLKRALDDIVDELTS